MHHWKTKDFIRISYITLIYTLLNYLVKQKLQEYQLICIDLQDEKLNLHIPKYKLGDLFTIHDFSSTFYTCNSALITTIAQVVLRLMDYLYM